MQQVFGMCSTLLRRNTDTRKRKLNIRRYKVRQVGVGCGRRPGLLMLSLSPGGALLSEERCVGVVLGDGAHWPVPGGPREGSPQALQTAGLDQPELPQEDDGALAAGPACWGWRRRRWRANLCSRSPQAAASFHEKLQAYSEVCRNFRPVFRYFCMERFLDPAVWMEKRLAYTRSVATSSIGTDGCWRLRLPRSGRAS